MDSVQNSIGEEEDIEIDEHPDEENNDTTMNGVKCTTSGVLSDGMVSESEDEYSNFPNSFLMIDNTINWKMLEYLCTGTKHMN